MKYNIQGSYRLRRLDQVGIDIHDRAGWHADQSDFGSHAILGVSLAVAKAAISPAFLTSIRRANAKTLLCR
jgi:enolase